MRTLHKSLIKFFSAENGKFVAAFDCVIRN